MTGLGITLTYLILWMWVFPESFGRHCARIHHGYERKRDKLRRSEGQA